MLMRKNPNNISFKQIGIFLVSILVATACTDQGASVPLTASDYPESASEQVQLYLTKCGECHAAPLPKIHTARQWPGVVQRMQFRMTSKAMPKLNKYEMNTIVNYLQKHARDKQGQDNIAQENKEQK